MQKTMDGRSHNHYPQDQPAFTFIRDRQHSYKMKASAQPGSHSGNQSGNSPNQNGRGNPPPMRKA